MTNNVYWIVCGFAALVVVCIALVLVRWRRVRQERETFGQWLATLGFVPSQAPLVGRFHWLGAWSGYPAILGLYEKPPRREESILEAGILILMQSGKLTNRLVHVRLSNPPRFMSQAQPALAARLEPELLEAAALIPHAQLLSLSAMLPGTTEEVVIRSYQHAEWNGAYLRTVLPRNSSYTEVSATLTRMSDWLDQL